MWAPAANASKSCATASAGVIAGGELPQRVADLPPYRSRSGIRPPDVIEYIQTMRGEAAARAGASEDEKRTAWWRKRAEYVAGEIEALAAWAGVHAGDA